jgi:hypothetical protein
MEDEVEEQEGEQTCRIKSGVSAFSIISSATMSQQLTRQLILYPYQSENC